MKKIIREVLMMVLFSCFVVTPMYGMYRSKKTYNKKIRRNKKKDLKCRNKLYKAALKQKFQNAKAKEKQQVKRCIDYLVKMEAALQEENCGVNEVINDLIKNNELVIPICFNILVSFFQNLKKHLLNPSVGMAKKGLKIAMPILVAEILSRIIPGVSTICHDYVEILCRNFPPGTNPRLPNGGFEMRNSYWKKIRGFDHCQKLSRFPLRVKKWTCGGYRARYGWRYDRPVTSWPTCYNIITDRRHIGDEVLANSTYMDTLSSFIEKNYDIDFSKFIIRIDGDAATISEATSPLLKAMFYLSAAVAGIVVTVGVVGSGYCLYVAYQKHKKKKKIRKFYRGHIEELQSGSIETESGSSVSFSEEPSDSTEESTEECDFY